MPTAADNTLASQVPVTVIIPARLASTRFPRKVLADETGRPLVQHVVDRCRQAKGIDRVIVAADHDDVSEALRPFETTVVLTRHDCRTGTDRVADAANRLKLPEESLVINVQADEPEIDPDVLEELALRMRRPTAHPMGTAFVAFPEDADPANPNLVKVVVGKNNSGCLWFSRSPIPYAREGRPQYKLHVGIYAYRLGFLYGLANYPPTPAEVAESLEQLRALEWGYRIEAVEARWHRGGIDTPEQYSDFVRRWKNKAMPEALA